MKSIQMWGARQNNLKGVDVQIPLSSFTVVCGPSGSGKSSLAFETLYAEGQRRFIESLSNYSKQFLSKAPKPDVDEIKNIPPAIAIEQKNSVKTSRSTVGTTTEILEYLRLLYEKAGEAFCPSHGLKLEKDSPSLGAEKILRTFAGERGFVLCPIPAEGRLLGEKKLLPLLQQEGFLRIYLPKLAPTKKPSTTKRKASKTTLKTPTLFATEELGQILELSDAKLSKNGLPKADLFIVIDRMVFQDSERDRLVDSLSQAFRHSTKYSKSVLTPQAIVLTVDGKRLLLSEDLSCSVCGFRLPALSSSLFSFNSPLGACKKCNGFGNILALDEAKVVPNPELSLAEGAIAPFAMPSATQDRRQLKAFCKKMGIDLHAPWKDLPQNARDLLWQGRESFYGVEGLFEYLETKKYKMHVRVFISRFKSPFTCTSCKGSRLTPTVEHVLVGGVPISKLSALSIEELKSFFEKLKLSIAREEVCKEVLRQINSRLLYLTEVGVGYLTLDRPTRTLSGGEYQRLNLANQLGMELSQTLYVLDEPTVGLHPRDSDRLIKILHRLRSLGNTLVVVEHDHDVIRSGTHVIEMGPGSGHLGGEVIFAGERDGFLRSETSLTAQYLRPSSRWVPAREPRPVEIETYKYALKLEGCSANNLKDVDVAIPLNRLVTVTGVSGSGKSTLITHTLYPALARLLEIEYLPAGAHKSIKGHERIKNVILVDQSPIGKTARSNPLTYLKIYDSIRTIMAATSEAKALGFTPGSFSLNVDGGRCPVCKGLGVELVDMVFMDDIEVKCEACDGRRFRPELLEITYKGKNIHQILKMTVAEAMDFFVSYPQIRKPLSLLKDVGLEYISLGQSANSLSGGESQRLKIARELIHAQNTPTLYILDEPTTGLHFREVHLLLSVLNKLVETGNSVVLVEHNLEVIRNSDYIIDLGPEAGAKGGEILAVGPPEKLMRRANSHTGHYLREYVERLNPGPRSFKSASKGSSAGEELI